MYSRERLREIKDAAEIANDEGGAEGYWAGRVLEVFDALETLQRVVGDLTGPIAWYKSEKSPDYWFVSEFTHGQVEGLRVRYRERILGDAAPKAGSNG